LLLYPSSVCEDLWVDCCREEARRVLELPDQKAQGFLVQIAFTRWFLDSAHKVFGEMIMRT
jgi:hypothetical protein